VTFRLTFLFILVIFLSCVGITSAQVDSVLGQVSNSETESYGAVTADLSFSNRAEILRRKTREIRIITLRYFYSTTPNDVFFR
jgi:hypothetical protein